MNRSYLMVAGDKQKHLEKIPTLDCDVCMINLEDGVFDKEFARGLLIDRFKQRGLKVKNKQVVVRINSLDSCGVEDINAINELKPDAIRVPKVNKIEDVKRALELIDNDIDVHLSIETKEAFNNLRKLKIDKRVTTVYLGILDLFESLELPQSLLLIDNPTVDYILSKFLIDSKIAGVNAVSFTFQDYKNIHEFTQWCNKTKKMGYSSKSCISPTQVEIVNRVFGLDDEVIKKAKYIKKSFEEQRAIGITGFSDELYGFIDEPIYKDALLALRKLV